MQVMDRLGLETLPIWNLSLVVHDVHKDYHALDSGGLCVFTDCDCSHACRWGLQTILEQKFQLFPCVIQPCQNENHHMQFPYAMLHDCCLHKGTFVWRLCKHVLSQTSSLLAFLR